MQKHTLKFPEQIALAALRIKAIEISLDKPYTWSSGWKCPIYTDNRKHLGYPENRALIIDALIQKITDEGIIVDGILGTTTAGIPWGTLLADKMGIPIFILDDRQPYCFPWQGNPSPNIGADIIATSAPFGLPAGIRLAHLANKPFIYVRARAKDHGLKNTIEGVYEPGKSVCFLTSSDTKLEERKSTLVASGLFVPLTYEKWDIMRKASLAGLRLLVVDDLTSTNGSALEEAGTARRLGAQVSDILSIFSYGFPVASAKAAAANIRAHSLCTYADVLAVVVEQGGELFSDNNVRLLKEWNADPVTWSKNYELSEEKRHA